MARVLLVTPSAQGLCKGGLNHLYDVILDNPIYPWIQFHMDTAPEKNTVYQRGLHIGFLVDFSDSSVRKESSWNAGDGRVIPGSGRSTGKRLGYSLSILGLPLWLSWERSKVKVFQSCPTLCDRVDIQSMEFSKPEDWSG